MEVQIAKGVVGIYENGEIVIRAKVAELINPIIDDTANKVAAGEIDLIKGTEIDKEIFLKGIALLKAMVNK